MTKIVSAFRVQRSAFLPLLFAAGVVFVYFFGLSIPLLGPDEPRYSQVAREMFERGDWITPTLGGFQWFEKPALLYWLQIAAYNLFGVSEFSARFGSALFGLGTILSLWTLGRFLATESTEATEEKETPLSNDPGQKDSEFSMPSVDNAFANWLAVITASSIGIIVFSRGASFDIILTFPITAALVGFFIFDLTQSREAAKPQSKGTSFDQNISVSPRLRVYLPLFAFYFFIGVALLAKGLVGIVFPFAIVGFYYLLSWRLPSRTFILSIVWGTLISAAVASAWYLPMYQRHGWEFIDEFFVQHHFQRFTSNKYFHPQPYYFFFWVLPLMTIPWLPFFLAGIWSLLKSIFNRRDAEKPRRTIENGELKIENEEAKSDILNFPFLIFHSEVSASPNLPISLSPLLLFSLAWLLVPLVFFSFSGSKLPGYILPSLPPALIIAAVCLFRFVQKSELRARVVKAAAVATFVIVVGLILFVVPRFADADSVKRLIEKANTLGFTREKVLTLHTVSHNAEFYAAGRLIRDETGKQRKFLGPVELLEEVRKSDTGSVLVIVPMEYWPQLSQSSVLTSTLIDDNGELVIAAVRGS